MPLSEGAVGAMPDFYVHFLTPDDHIAGREAICAASAADAIRIGFDALQHWNTAAPTRRALAVEIWCGATRVFSGRPVDAALPSIRAIHDPEHWRQRAEEAGMVAEKLTDATAKRTMRNISEGYEAMAERAEKFGAEYGVAAP